MHLWKWKQMNLNVSHREGDDVSQLGKGLIRQVKAFSGIYSISPTDDIKFFKILDM